MRIRAGGDQQMVVPAATDSQRFLRRAETHFEC